MGSEKPIKHWESLRGPAKICDQDTRRLRFLASKLRHLREKLGLSQAAVGRMMGKNQLWVLRAEHSGDISSIALERLAAIYGVPVSKFCTMKPAKYRTDIGYLNLSDEEWSKRARREAAQKVMKATDPRPPARNPFPFLTKAERDIMLDRPKPQP